MNINFFPHRGVSKNLSHLNLRKYLPQFASNLAKIDEITIMSIIKCTQNVLNEINHLVL